MPRGCHWAPTTRVGTCANCVIGKSEPSSGGRVDSETSNTHSPALATLPVPRRRWTIIFCTFVVAAVSYLDRNNISIAAASVQREFGLTNVQLGVLFSAFVTGYAFTQPFA